MTLCLMESVHQFSAFLSFFAPGLTPLHCAAISHSATMKSFFAPMSDLSDSSLHSLAEDKLSCVQLLLSSGASLLSQVRPCILGDTQTVPGLELK